VIPRRRAHVAQRQPVFDQRGSSATLPGLKRDRVLADGAAKLFRVHAIASAGHPCHPSRGLGNCSLPDGSGLWAGARNRSYTSSRLSGDCRTCDVCSKQEGDHPPSLPRSERVSLDYAACTWAFGGRDLRRLPYAWIVALGRGHFSAAAQGRSVELAARGAVSPGLRRSRRNRPRRACFRRARARRGLVPRSRARDRPRARDASCPRRFGPSRRG
jgi:hypothetical protein